MDPSVLGDIDRYFTVFLRNTESEARRILPDTKETALYLEKLERELSQFHSAVMSRVSASLRP